MKHMTLSTRKSNRFAAKIHNSINYIITHCMMLSYNWALIFNIHVCTVAASRHRALLTLTDVYGRPERRWFPSQHSVSRFTVLRKNARGVAWAESAIDAAGSVARLCCILCVNLVALL